MEFRRRFLKPLDRIAAPAPSDSTPIANNAVARDSLAHGTHDDESTAKGMGGNANGRQTDGRQAALSRGARARSGSSKLLIGIDGERIAWPIWLRSIERKRRLLSRSTPSRLAPLPLEYFAAATFASFGLDGIEASEAQIAQALARGAANRIVRTRLTLRIRNHVSILRRIESAVRLGESLKGQTVIRWYTSISCGLSTAGLDDATVNRLDAVVRRINSPQLRLQPAVMEVAQLHTQLLSDPFVPSFNGILARLLLQYHLGRCGLPPVIFSPETDKPFLLDAPRLLARIMEMVGATYDMLLAPKAAS